MHLSLSASTHPLALLPDVVSLVWVLACKILHNKQTNTNCSSVIFVESTVTVQRAYPFWTPAFSKLGPPRGPLEGSAGGACSALS